MPKPDPFQAEVARVFSHLYGLTPDQISALRNRFADWPRA
jgi:hypothetical protein